LIPMHLISAVHGEAFAKIKTQIHGVTETRKIVKDRVTENTLIPTHLRLDLMAVAHGLENVASLTIHFAIGNEKIVKVLVVEFGKTKNREFC